MEQPGDRKEPSAGERKNQEHEAGCSAASSDLWAAVGVGSWTAEVEVGPFLAGEIQVNSVGRLGVEVHAAHYHGDALVASIVQVLPPPPSGGPFVVSHAVSLHGSVLLTAWADAGVPEPDVVQTDGDGTAAEAGGNKDDPDDDGRQEKIVDSISEIEIA